MHLSKETKSNLKQIAILVGWLFTVVVAAIVLLGCGDSAVEQLKKNERVLYSRITQLENECDSLKAQAASRPEHILNEIKRLEHQKAATVDRLGEQRLQMAAVTEQINKLEAEKERLAAENEDRIVYQLKLELKQSRVSLDIGKHIKDSMNATEFWIAVDKRLYDKARVGDSLLDSFRGGSFLVNGTTSSWKLTVREKKTKTVPRE